MDSIGFCAMCGRQTFFWCSRCHAVWYCSQLHNIEGWPQHKLTCTPIEHWTQAPAVISVVPRPPESVLPKIRTITAIYFGVTSRRPTLIDIEYRPSPSFNPTRTFSRPLVMLDHVFENEPIEAVILEQGLNGDRLRYPLHIWYTPRQLQEGTPVNQSIEHVTSSAAKKSWAGPVVALKFNGSRQKGYVNANSLDLPALSTYFLAYE